MNGLPPSTRAAPTCAGLSLALPFLGMVLSSVVASFPAVKGRGEFAEFAPSFMAALAGFPLGLLGIVLAVAAMVRRERWLALAVVGLILNLTLLVLCAPVVWAWAGRVGGSGGS